jgi:hypothetical protein
VDLVLVLVRCGFREGGQDLLTDLAGMLAHLWRSRGRGTRGEEERSGGVACHESL